MMAVLRFHSAPSEYSDKACLLRELENLLVWNRRNGKQQYLHIVRAKGHGKGQQAFTSANRVIR